MNTKQNEYIQLLIAKVNEELPHLGHVNTLHLNVADIRMRIKFEYSYEQNNASVIFEINTERMAIRFLSNGDHEVLPCTLREYLSNPEYDFEYNLKHAVENYMKLTTVEPDLDLIARTLKYTVGSIDGERVIQQEKFNKDMRWHFMNKSFTSPNSSVAKVIQSFILFRNKIELTDYHRILFNRIVNIIKHFIKYNNLEAVRVHDHLVVEVMNALWKMNLVVIFECAGRSRY